MLENKKSETKLIIVCDEKSKVYGEYLKALISQNDDVDDKIIGTKDGTVVTAIYTDKNYKNSLAKIPSNTHVLFIGSFKEAKEQRIFITSKFKKYGMNYGWLGKKAIMYVDDKMITSDEYDKFFPYSKEYIKEVEKVTTNFLDKVPDMMSSIGMLLPFTYILRKSLVYSVAAAACGAIIGKKVSTKMKDKEIKKQQYICLIAIFYLKDLQKFLEG